MLSIFVKTKVYPKLKFIFTGALDVLKLSLILYALSQSTLVGTKGKATVFEPVSGLWKFIQALLSFT